MTLPLVALGVQRARIACPIDVIGDVLHDMAQAAAEGAAPAVELPPGLITEYWDEKQAFPGSLAGTPPPLAWIEYSIAEARPLRTLHQAVDRMRRAKRGVATPERVAVGFVAFDGAGPTAWWSDALAANIAGNGFRSVDTAHTVLAVVAGTTPWQEGRLLALAAMVVAFDGAGDDMGNHWVVLDNRDETTALVDRQVERQGLPGVLILSSPAWAALSGLSKVGS